MEGYISVWRPKKVMGLQCFFRCEFCFDWFQKRIAFYWILMGFCEYPWNDIVLNGKCHLKKRGPFFGAQKFSPSPKKHGVSLRGRSGGEGSLRFHWDHRWLDQFFARWNQGTLPKWVEKRVGGSWIFRLVVFFFSQKKTSCPEDLEETRWKNDF